MKLSESQIKAITDLLDKQFTDNAGNEVRYYFQGSSVGSLRGLFLKIISENNKYLSEYVLRRDRFILGTEILDTYNIDAHFDSKYADRQYEKVRRYGSMFVDNDQANILLQHLKETLTHEQFQSLSILMVSQIDFRSLIDDYTGLDGILAKLKLQIDSKVLNDNDWKNIDSAFKIMLSDENRSNMYGVFREINVLDLMSALLFRILNPEIFMAQLTRDNFTKVIDFVKDIDDDKKSEPDFIRIIRSGIKQEKAKLPKTEEKSKKFADSANILSLLLDIESGLVKVEDKKFQVAELATQINLTIHSLFVGLYADLDEMVESRKAQHQRLVMSAGSKSDIAVFDEEATEIAIDNLLRTKQFGRNLMYKALDFTDSLAEVISGTSRGRGY